MNNTALRAGTEGRQEKRLYAGGLHTCCFRGAGT